MLTTERPFDCKNYAKLKGMTILTGSACTGKQLVEEEERGGGVCEYTVDEKRRWDDSH